MIIQKAEGIFEIIESEDQAREAIAGRSILAYMAQWCGPCRVMVEEINRRYPVIKRKLDDAGVKLVYLDRDNRALGRFFVEQHIENIPAFVAYEKGRRLGEVFGLRLGRELENLISLYSRSQMAQVEQRTH